MKSTGINDSLVEALKKEDISIPTKVQSEVIPKALRNLDVIAKSNTGTGKTLAYLLPVFEKHSYKNNVIQAIILTPTHELAVQVVRCIERLSENSDNHLTAMAVIGNVNIDRQVKKLKTKPNIVVGSPGRILELIKKRKITAHTVKTIVIDEVDRLLDKNNKDTVLAIVKSTLKERQIMCFSATVSADVIDIVKEIGKNPSVVMCDVEDSLPSSIEHRYFEVEARKKVELFRKIVNAMDITKCIVFVDPSPDIELITQKLKFHKIDAESIHGNNIKLDRKKILDNFRKGKLKFMIASDIAARGLDIGDVTHVVNFNLQKDFRSYIHRAGRTGRNGNRGVVISLVTPRELVDLRKHAKKMHINLIASDIYKGKIIDKGECYNEKSTSKNNNGVGR